jgi:membrane fusion protein (multidrug efflux system)
LKTSHLFLGSLALSTSLFLLGACGGHEAPAAAGPLEVQVVEVKPQTIILHAEFVGTIDGIENADIRARVAGYLEQVHFKEGFPVKAGDLLFTIDPVLSEAEVRKAQGDVGLARASAAKAQADVDRLTPLVATNAVSRQELDHAVAAKQSADAQIAAAQGSLATAQANLGFTKVRSPIDGVIGVRQVSIGSLVGQSEPTLLTTVSKLDPVRVRFPISEQLYLKHAVALSRLLTTDFDASSYPMDLVLADGSTYPERGWLALIDRAVSVGTGSILLEARFPNPKGMLRPGQFARVRARTGKLDQALAVPQRAVIERQGMHELLVLGKDGKVERRAVTTGPTVGNVWVIEKGLVPGDKVLLDGLQKLRPGALVKPTMVPQVDAAPPEARDAAPSPAPTPAAPSPAPTPAPTTGSK